MTQAGRAGKPVPSARAPAASATGGAWRRLVRPGLQYYLLALAFFTATFAVIPFTIYADSGDDWGFPWYQLLYITGFGVVLCLGAFVVIRLLALVHLRGARALACVLFCLGVFLLLAHVFAPVKLGPLDGSEMVSAEPVLDSIVEAGFAVVLALVLVQLLRGRGRTIAAVFSLALVGLALGYLGAFAYAHHARLAALKVPTTGAPGVAGNVYQIVLDTMQTDAFLAALRGAGADAAFTGFDLFANNVSNYITTVPSSASYFTGSLYREGDYQTWTHGWRTTTGLLPMLKNHGYQVSMYSPFPQWNNEYVDRFWYNVDIYEQDSGFADTGLYDLVHIWLASFAPNFLTNEALPVAGRLRDRIFLLLTGQSKPLSIREGLHPYAGLMMLRRLVREEDLRAPNGQYVYAHAALPHGPFVLDRSCNYVGRSKPGKRERIEAYVDQAGCAVRLVVAFLDHLRRLGRYDQATIVVHADTGHGVGFVDQAAPAGKSTTLGASDEMLRSSLNALLLVKRPGARGPLRIVDTPTQLIDLYPTLLDLLDLEPGAPTAGKSVYAIGPRERREARFAFDPENKHGPGLIEVRIEDQTDLPHSKLSVLGPAADPASWAGK